MDSSPNPPRSYLHGVFAQGAGVRVGLVAHLAHVGLVGRVHMHVLLAVAAVGEAPVALEEVAHERLLPCGQKRTPRAKLGDD